GSWSLVHATNEKHRRGSRTPPSYIVECSPMSATAPRRNDPCPCGSGRKFKHCCLDRHTAEDSARLRLRGAEGRVVDTLLEFTAKSWGDSLIAHAWEDFWIYDD